MRRDDSEWHKLRELVSPSFFDVLPAAELRRQVSELARNALRRKAFGQVRSALAEDLQQAGLPIRLGWPPGPGELGRKQQGALVLRLFFRQLSHHDTALLDLRSRRFRADGRALWWNPRALWVSWDAQFLGALRQLYAGFYEADAAQFRAALARLNLSCAEETMRTHFGDGSADAVSFSVRGFRSAFHDTFVTCRKAGSQLHPNFLPLGILLACLYENLEQLGGTHDVSAAFRASRGG